MTDIDDEGRKAELDAKRKLLAQRDIDDIQFVMGSEQGRRVIWSLLEKGQVFGACFNVDPHITAFNEGQRNLALVLFQRVMSHCPDQYLKMAAEAGEDNL
ncbi:hypothetical protein [Salmonella enterica]|uniref:Bbp19 family protein n=1 Tax=Salmonella enterica TaxID=28901 RepID=UPI0025712239|nr:hypothetical protein [Salmonella enterica]EAZ4935319.1 hypothetical protein [Salmonella enterica]MDL4014483.1 hypothetical protein [Salmonella enterica]MDL4082829.1 hypothetical protein [Salmonella enterica]MDL4132949.1 hypothetical protein [Salmonella enterica]MDL4136986.1 hypothetical protein [Salmonella enterica]